MTEGVTSRRYPVGAEIAADGNTHFRVWAPKARRVHVVLEESADDGATRTFHQLDAEADGYFAGLAPAGAGALYRLRAVVTGRVSQACVSPPRGSRPGRCVEVDSTVTLLRTCMTSSNPLRAAAMRILKAFYPERSGAPLGSKATSRGIAREQRQRAGFRMGAMEKSGRVGVRPPAVPASCWNNCRGRCRLDIMLRAKWPARRRYAHLPGTRPDAPDQSRSVASMRLSDRGVPTKSSLLNALYSILWIPSAMARIWCSRVPQQPPSIFKP